MDISKKEITIEHPLEEVLGIQPCTTTTEVKEIVVEDPVKSPTYDDKDEEINSKFEEVYIQAMTKVTNISDEFDRVEGRYKARIGEVTASMLSVALSAAREQREMKAHKDKVSLDQQSSPKTVNNNLVITDRNDILRLLSEANKK